MRESEKHYHALRRNLLAKSFGVSFIEVEIETIHSRGPEIRQAVSKIDNSHSCQMAILVNPVRLGTS